MVEIDKLRYYAFLRKRVQDYENAFRSFVTTLISKFGSKLTIILFGSRARFDNKESSDFDLLVIVENTINKLDLMEELYSLKPTNVPIDIIVMHINELKSATVKKMLSPSIILYDGLKIFHANKSQRVQYYT